MIWRREAGEGGEGFIHSRTAVQYRRTTVSGFCMQYHKAAEERESGQSAAAQRRRQSNSGERARCADARPHHTRR
jgi:hypothetical protein